MIISLCVRRLLLLAFLLAMPLHAHAGDAFPALHKGVNFAGWLANAVRQPLYDRDFAQVKAAGFDNIRLPVNPEEFGFRLTTSGGGFAAMDMTKIDAAIDLAIRNGLPVVLDIHPAGSFMKTLEDKPDWAEPAFIDLWAGIAEHYKAYPHDKLAFEILNEPQYYHAESRYMKLAASVVGAIRYADPGRTIVLCAPDGSSVAGLQKIEPLPMADIIYDFHYYLPYIVTHQGINQGFEKLMIRYFHNIPYPSSLVDKPSSYYAPNAPDQDEAAKELKEYTDADWNAARIAEKIAPAKQWADKYHVPVICGEFGAMRAHIEPDSRYRWISDTRKAFEADGIGWQIWDYTDNFGIASFVGETTYEAIDGSTRFVNPETGRRVLESAAIAALGLREPRARQ